MNVTWLPPLAAMILVPFLTPIIMRALARKFPARAANPGEYQLLRPQYRWLEIGSRLATLLGFVGSIVVLITLHVENTPWLVIAVFGWAILTPIIFIGLFTLPRGTNCWREFWRFYELTYQTSLRFVGPVYVVVCALGLISTAVLFSH